MSRHGEPNDIGSVLLKLVICEPENLEKRHPKCPETGCWEWPNAAFVSGGYGAVRLNGKTYRVHKLVYELLRGLVLAGEELDHLCRNPLCANPDHLEPVPHDVNMGRSIWAMKTHCPNGHPYSGDNLYVSPRRGDRQCRICMKETNKRACERRKERRRLARLSQDDEIV